MVVLGLLYFPNKILYDFIFPSLVVVAAAALAVVVVVVEEANIKINYRSMIISLHLNKVVVVVVVEEANIKINYRSMLISLHLNKVVVVVDIVHKIIMKKEPIVVVDLNLVINHVMSEQIISISKITVVHPHPRIIIEEIEEVEVGIEIIMVNNKPHLGKDESSSNIKPMNNQHHLVVINNNSSRCNSKHQRINHFIAREILRILNFNINVVVVMGQEIIITIGMIKDEQVDKEMNSFKRIIEEKIELNVAIIMNHHVVK